MSPFNCHNVGSGEKYSLGYEVCSFEVASVLLQLNYHISSPTIITESVDRVQIYVILQFK